MTPPALSVAVKESEMDGHCSAHAGMEAWLSKIEAKVDKLIEGVLVGNGQPSLKERIRTLEQVREMQEHDAERNENRALVALRILAPYALGAIALWFGIN